MFITNPANEDLQHPVHVAGLASVDSADGAKVFIHRPDVRYGFTTHSTHSYHGNVSGVQSSD